MVTKRQEPPTHLRLSPEEKEWIGKVREAMEKRSFMVRITRSAAMHAMLAKGYEALIKELGLR